MSTPSRIEAVETLSNAWPGEPRNLHLTPINCRNELAPGVLYHTHEIVAGDRFVPLNWDILLV